MSLFYAYIACSLIGFIVAAIKRGQWWDDPNQHDKETIVPIAMTLFGFLFIAGVVLYGVYLTFMGVTRGAANGMDKIAAWWKARKSHPIRTRVAIPSPMVKSVGYREAAPKPCIACGAPTSLNQDALEVMIRQREFVYDPVDKYTYAKSAK
jgi:hypothetical protein